MTQSALLLDAPSGVTGTGERVGPELARFGLELVPVTDLDEAVETLAGHAVAGGWPGLVLLGPHLLHPLPAARRLARVAPQAQLVFLVDEEEGEALATPSLLQELATPLAMVGSHWTVVDVAPARVAGGLGAAIRSARGRARMRTTIAGINRRLSSQPRADLSELHRYTTSHVFLASVLEQAQDAIIATTMDGTVVTWNEAAERLFGVPRDEAIGRPVEDVSVGVWRASVPALLERARERGAGYVRSELRLRAASGRGVDVELVLSQILDRSGATDGLVLLARDITARNALERRLQRARRLESLGVMAGGVAHDFNNLLTGILGHVDLAYGELPPSSKAVAYLKEVRMACLRAATLCRQMLAFAGLGKYRKEALDVNRLVRDATRPFADELPDGIALRSDLARNLPRIDGDADQLHQLLYNLLTNGAEAIGDGAGRITVSTSLGRFKSADLGAAAAADELPDGAYVVIDVADTGSGLEDATAQQAFEPFFSTKFTGRGLGLPAALGIARAHGGTVTLRGEPGAGATARVFLPPGASGGGP